MSSQVENQNANESLTFEKVWAAIQESARKFDLELEKSRKEREEAARKSNLEFEKMRKEADQQMKKLREAMKETDRQMKETDRIIKETDRQMKETDKKIGELGNRFGELAEHLVAPSIMDKFNDLGFSFTKTALGCRIKEIDNPQIRAEIDILLENGDTVVAVEVKSKPTQGDVDDHIRRMKVLRRAADRNSDKRAYCGAVAGAIMIGAVRNYAVKKGFYVIEQSGDTVLINIPEGFKPREW